MAELNEKQRIFFIIVGSLIAAVLVFGGFVFYAVNLIQDYIEEITPTEPYKSQTKKYTDADIKEYIDTQYGEIGGGGGTVISSGGFVVPNTIGYDADTATNTTLSLIEPDWTFGIGTTTTIADEGFFTLAVYGSSTIQTPINTTNAFRIQNAASSTVFNVSTIDGSATLSGALTVGSCSGCAASFGFPWDSSALGNATSTLIILDGGFISSASSTISSTLNVTSTSTFDGNVTIGTSTPHQPSMLNIEISSSTLHGIKITGAFEQDEHLLSLENQIGRELLTLGADGDLEIDHLEDEAGSGAFHIDNDINGFPDISSIVINHILTGLLSEESSIGVSITTNTADSAVNSSFEGFGCFSVGSGSASLDCIAVGVGFNALHIDSGTRGDPSFVFTASSSFSTFTDITASAISESNDTLFFEANNEYIVVGFTSQFGEISFDLNTEAGKSIFSSTDTFEHSASGDTWVAFAPNDLTDGHQESGIIRMDVENIGGDWTTATVNGQGSVFWIRWQRTRNNIQTTPIENLIQISTVIEFDITNEGIVNMDSFFASSTAIVDGLVIAKGGFISTASSTISGSLHVSGNLSASSSITIDGTSLFALSSGNVGIATTTPGTLLSVYGSAFINDLLTVGGALSATSTLTVDGLSTLAGFISTASSTVSSTLHISNNLSASSTLTVDGESIFNANTTIGNAATDVLTITSNASTTNSLTIGLDLFTDGISTFTGLSTLVGGFISSASSTIAASLHIGGVLNASSTAAISSLSIDATGALVIPQGTNPTVDAAGEIAMDTSATGQLVVHDGSVVSVYRPDGRMKAGLVATSTLTIKGAYGTAGTTTIIIAGYDVPITLQSIRCLTDPLLSSNGSSTLRIGDGTNFSEYAQCDDREGGISTSLSSNVTFTAGEEIHIEIGSEVGNPDYISFDIPWLYTRI